MVMVMLVIVLFRTFMLSSSCTVIYKTTTLPGCEQDFTPTIPALNSSTVTYGTECLLLCRNNNKCNGISICPDSGDPGRFSCSLFGTATDGTCGSLASEVGCRYLEFEIVSNGPQCVPPRIFDEERDECVCDPVWMYGPNCDQYYIGKLYSLDRNPFTKFVSDAKCFSNCDQYRSGRICRTSCNCTEAYSDGLTVPGDYLVMEIKPTVSLAPFLVKCLLNYDGYTLFQKRRNTCPADLTGLGWNDFRDGFGDFSCSFHLGLEKTYEILQNGEFTFNVKLNGDNGLSGNAYYKKFTLGSESTNYVADWNEFSTRSDLPCEDGFSYGGSTYTVKGARFATHDNDFNGCAQAEGTGWWYNDDCSLVNMNLPLYPPQPSTSFVSWPVNGTLEKVEYFTIFLKRTG